jgi:RNA recognition motif-containing protein
MQSIYNYDMAYTPLIPQHILVASPQVGSQQYGRFPSNEIVYDDVPLDALNEYEYHQVNAHMPSVLEGSMQSLNISDQDDLYSEAFQSQFTNDSTPSFKYATSVVAAGVDFNSAPSRTVYLGNVPGYITPKELLDHVRSGVIESVRILPEKMCAFISFLDESSALLFHSDAILKRLTIKDNDIKIGWGRNMPISPVVMGSVQRDGATRNVYIGHLPSDITEEKLAKDMEQFGTIDTIKILREKGIAFVHFCSIASAIKVVTTLASKMPLEYGKKKIFYGKDRCAFVTKTQQHNAAQYLGLAPGMEHLVTSADREFISSTLLQQSAAAAAIATTAGGANNLGNRTIYLGNLPKDVKLEEICNVVRGGLLEVVKYFPDRHVCFVTFIDPIAAAQFFAMSQLHGLTIHTKKIKIGWGKHSGPLSVELTLAVSSGASRNIYIGNIDLHDPKFSQEALRTKFQEFGTVEQINYLAEKSCVFINFANISHAILAIDKIKIDPDFKDLKINFGKDRCGNIPRQFVNKKL